MELTISKGGFITYKKTYITMRISCIIHTYYSMDFFKNKDLLFQCEVKCRNISVTIKKQILARISIIKQRPVPTGVCNLFLAYIIHYFLFQFNFAYWFCNVIIKCYAFIFLFFMFQSVCSLSNNRQIRMKFFYF